MGKAKFISALVLSAFSSMAFAEDISGTWKNIDDKTGSSKAVLEIRQESNGTYTAKVVKVTPRPGYTPKDTCIDCPAPYTNKPIIGMQVITGLKTNDHINYCNGKIIDPVSGKIYSLKGKVSANSKKLFLRGYFGVSAVGRSQTWVRVE